MDQSISANALFTNTQMNRKVIYEHNRIRDTYSGLTLMETLIVGYSWSREKIEEVIKDGKLKELKEFIPTWKHGESSRQLDSFKLYNNREIQRTRWITVFIQKILASNNKKLIECLNTNQIISLSSLTDMSLLAHDYASVASALKSYIVANYSKEELYGYLGIQAMTGPVVSSLYKLFGKNYSHYEQTIFCNNIAQQCDKSPTYINTALWLLGK